MKKINENIFYTEKKNINITSKDNLKIISINQLFFTPLHNNFQFYSLKK